MRLNGDARGGEPCTKCCHAGCIYLFLFTLPSMNHPFDADCRRTPQPCLVVGRVGGNIPPLSRRMSRVQFLKSPLAILLVKALAIPIFMDLCIGSVFKLFLFFFFFSYFKTLRAVWVTPLSVPFRPQFTYRAVLWLGAQTRRRAAHLIGTLCNATLSQRSSGRRRPAAAQASPRSWI